METSAQRNTSTERQPVHYCSDIPGMEDATRWPLAGSALTSPPPRPPVWSRGAASGSCVKSRSTSWSSLSRAAISRSLASSWAARGGTGGHQEEEVGRVDACASIGMPVGGKRKGGVLGPMPEGTDPDARPLLHIPDPSSSCEPARASSPPGRWRCAASGPRARQRPRRDPRKTTGRREEHRPPRPRTHPRSRPC
jgi:hypothetical protein